jgi:hypothetical protein
VLLTVQIILKSSARNHSSAPSLHSAASCNRSSVLNCNHPEIRPKLDLKSFNPDTTGGFET